MKRILGLTSVLALLLTTAPHASAATRPARTVHIDATFNDNGGTVYPRSCSLDQPGLCSFMITGEASWSGDIQGWSIYRAFGYFDPATGSVQSENLWEHFVEAHVNGCGDGTMMWHSNFSITPQEQDPTSGQIVGSGTWIYVRGSGTGDLDGMVAGSLEVKGTRFAPPFFINHGEAHGTIQCH